tara:strand:- start:84 stop:188 length:105 start_codon:yes stop_codon:yes gene_type:complete
MIKANPKNKKNFGKLESFFENKEKKKIKLINEII